MRTFSVSVFDDDSFAFPDMKSQANRSRQGAYNATIDAMLVSTVGDRSNISARLSHEVAHQLLSIDTMPMRVVRRLSGALYSSIWYLLSIVAEYGVDLAGIKLAEVKVKGNGSPADELIRPLINTIKNYDFWMTGLLRSVKVVYEVAAIELGIRLLRNEIDQFQLSKLEKELVDIEASAIAPDLYWVHPTYWTIKLSEDLHESHEELHHRLARLNSELDGPGDPGYFQQYRRQYEDLFRSLYKSYKQSLSVESLFDRVRYTSYGIDSPLALRRTNDGVVRITTMDSPVWLWTHGRRGPQDTMNEDSLSDAWRLSQSLELDTMRLPDVYRFPMRIMLVLDQELFKQHAARAFSSKSFPSESTEGPTGEIGTRHSSIFSFATDGLATTFSMNESMVMSVRQHLNSIDPYNYRAEEWWRWLLLFESIRMALKSGVPIRCPLIDTNTECSARCPIKINLSFLRNHTSWTEATPVCGEVPANPEIKGE